MRRRVALGLFALAACGEHGRASSAPDGPEGLDATDAPSIVAPDAPPTTLVATPATLDFGSIPINSTTQPLSVTIIARGGSAQAPSFDNQVILGPDAGAFAFEGTGCTWNGDVCTTRLRFLPTAVGVATAEYVVSHRDGKVIVPLRGTGTDTASLQVVPTLHDYGAIGVGAASAWTFTFVNATAAPTGALSVSIGGADPTQFVTGADSCTGSMLSVNASCTVVVTFAPSSSGSKAAMLAVTGSPGGTVGASLLGSGASGNALVITPATFDFGSVAQGNSSLGTMFTVTNTGTTTTGLLTTMMAGNHPGDFIKQFDQCNGHALGAGAACTLFITFEPGPVGPRNARVQVSASPGGFTAADLSGTCTP